MGRAHHRGTNAYSEDLREKMVEAKERGMPTVEVARAFGAGLSSAKRYAKVAREGGSLRPKRSPGRGARRRTSVPGGGSLRPTWRSDRPLPSTRGASTYGAWPGYR